MKKIIITTALLTVGVAAFAQQKNALNSSIKNDNSAKKDTIFTIQLPKQSLQLLFSSMDGFGSLIRRSPDMSALQADEAAKNIAALAAEIYQQVKPQLPEEKDAADTKKSVKSSQ